jgi:cytochrome c oxidase subunit 2
VLPGEVRKLIITPNKVGTYVVKCAELCGLGHAAMLQRVIVMPRAQFDAWARGGAKHVGGGGTGAGKTLFINNGCGGCHTFTPAGSAGNVGPNLDKLPDLAKQAHKPLEAFVRESIADPSAYVQPGYPNVMPHFNLSSSDLDMLVAFLTGGAGATS